MFGSLLSILVSGYQLSDLLIYLPMSVYLRDQTLYPSNPLIQQLLSMPYPAYRAYALVYSQWLLFLVFAASRIALIAGVWRLGSQLVGDPRAVTIGLFLLILTPSGFGSLGGTSFFQSEPSQFDLAVPFCVFALSAALAKRQLLAFVLAGLGFNLQPILGAVVMTLLAVNVLVENVYRRRQLRLQSAIAVMVVGVIVAVPAMVQTLVGLGSRLTEQPPDYLEIVKFTAFYQIYPSTFPPSEFVSSALVAIAACLALRRGVAERHTFTVALWLGTIAAFCLAGTVFSEIFPLSLALKLMPFRATLFLKVLGMVLIGGLVLREVGHLRGAMTGAKLAGFGAICAATLFSAPIHIPGVSPATDLELAADWARSSTPRDAVFATAPDPSVAGFTLFSERSTLGDYKLDTQAVWDPGFAHEAYVRLAALGCNGPWNPWCLRNRYSEFGAQDLIRLKDNFGTCYALMPYESQVTLPMAYENATYRVYALCT